MWWDLYNKKTQPGGAGDGMTANIESWKHWQHAGEYAQKKYADPKSDWEGGRPDYEGADRFDNILTYMSAMMLETKPSPPSTKE